MSHEHWTSTHTARWSRLHQPFAFDLRVIADTFKSTSFPMHRKISAIAFMVVMTLLITLKHPVLGYCLCLDSYFTGGCTCGTAQPNPQPTSGLKNATESCCTSCGSNSAGKAHSDTFAAVSTDPCDDCTEYFNLEVGDFLWDATDDVSGESIFSVPASQVYPQSMMLAESSIFSTAAPIRGDPPPGTLCDSVPIYLRHSVLRL